MEDILKTSQDYDYDDSNITDVRDSNITDRNSHIEDVIYARFILKVVTCIIVCVGLPLTLVAIYALYSMVRNNHVAPIYVINLLITDLLQICCMIVEVEPPKDFIISDIFSKMYNYCLWASVGFMVCVSMERYLVIAWPLWYHFRRTIKSSVVVCVLVWVLPIGCFSLYIWTRYSILGVLLLLPFPLLIFSLVGTLKALSAFISVPHDEKRRIVGMLVLVLLIYTLLFLPRIIWFLKNGFDSNNTLNILSDIFLKLSPLADLVLYVFMKKGTIDKLLVSVCCCRMDSSDMEMDWLAGCGDTSSTDSALSSPPLSGQSEQQT